jgi:hypothetical protein
MQDRQRKRIEEKITIGYDFVASEYIGQGWATFRKFSGGFVGFFLFSFFIGLFLGQIPYLGFLLSTFVIGPVLRAGYYIVSDRIVRGAAFSFGDFFNGFQHIGQLAAANVTMGLILGLAFLPSIFTLQSAGFFEWYVALQETVDPFGGLPPMPELSGKDSTVIFLNLIPIVYLMVGYTFAMQFIVFHQYNFWDALETSRRLVSRRWFAVFMLFLTFFALFMVIYLPASLVALVSPLLIVPVMIGLLCLMPVVYCAIFAAFADITDLHRPEDDEHDEILDHLIE